MRAKGVKVEKRRAEQVRRWLLEQGLLEPSLKPISEGEHVCFPVVRAPEGMCVVEMEFEERVQRAPIPRMHFDVVGDIALLDISGEGVGTGELERARALLAHRGIRAVYGRLPVRGEFRISPLIHLAGERRTHTIHRENGCVFELDIERVYFNPRLATERARVERRTPRDAVVLDMFAGVGPFSILLAKRSRERRVYAAEKNPVACEYLRANIARNHVDVHVFEGDVRLHPRVKADAIIMNLPHSAPSFLPTALRHATAGAHLFCYTISPTETLDEHARGLCAKGNLELVDVHVVKSYAPGVVVACVEMEVPEAKTRAKTKAKRY